MSFQSCFLLLSRKASLPLPHPSTSPHDIRKCFVSSRFQQESGDRDLEKELCFIHIWVTTKWNGHNRK